MNEPPNHTAIFIAGLYWDTQASCKADRRYDSREIYIWSKIGVVEAEL